MFKAPILFGISLIVSVSASGQDAFNGLLERALSKNAEYAAALKEKEAAEAQVRASRSAYYPTLDAVAGWEDRRVELEPARGTVGYLRGQLNLFNGLKDQAQVDRARLELQIKEARAEIKKRELKLALREVLSEMHYLHGLQQTLTEEIRTTQNQKQMAARKVSAGLTSSVDQIEFDLRTDELEIRKRQIDQSHVEAHQKLYQIFGEEIRDEETDKVSFRTLAEFEKILKSAKLESNPRMRIAESEASASELERTVSRGQFLPKLDVEYAFGRVTPSDEREAGFDESQVGVFLTIPLFAGFRNTSEYRAATALSGARDREKNQVMRDLQSEFEVVREKMKEALSLYQINERKRASSKKYFDMTLAEYRRGIKNSPDLVGATERLFDSERQKFELLKDLEILSARLENLM